MEIARVIINGNEARAIDTKRITKGMRGATIRVTYADPMWDSLTKLVVFEGATEAGFLHEGEIVEVPPKVLAESGGILRFGVCGKDADSAVVIPTVWAELGQILGGVPTDIKPPSGVSPSLLMQILGMIGDLKALETEARNNLVAAINEVLAKVGTGTGGSVDLTGYAKLDDVPTKISQLNNDSGFITNAVLDLLNYYTKSETYTREEIDRKVSAIPKFSIQAVTALPTENISDTTIYLLKAGNESGDLYTEYLWTEGKWEILGSQRMDLTGYATESWVQAGYQPKGKYLTEAPVDSVNGKTGAVKLSAADVGARPDTWMPTAQEVGALPSTYTPPNQTAEQVGADPKGTAAAAVSGHNADTAAHNDLRLEVKALADRLAAFFDSDDTTLDELSEIVSYITSNKSLIEAVTTSKVSVSDIINNLTTNVANKPLSAAQGVALKALIDGLSSGKLDASKLTDAINAALAQAKASGEFMGDPGRGIKSIARTSGNGAAGTTDTYTITYTDNTTSTFQVRNGSNGTAGTAATFEITGATALAYGATPTVTEQSGSTEQARKYALGIPAGKPGEPGGPGATPQRGVDYWTADDIAAMDAKLAEMLAERAQLRPEPAESLEWLQANGDTSKLYVLTDKSSEHYGYIYGWYMTEVESGPTYTNVLPTAINADKTPYVGTNGEKGYKTGYRLNSSRAEVAVDGRCCTGFIPIKYMDEIRFKNIITPPGPSFNGYIFFYKSDFSNDGMAYEFEGIWDNVIIPGKIKDLVSTATNASSSAAYMRISTAVISDASVITINEEIVEGGTVTEYAWANTGIAFVSTDYGPRITELENKVAALGNGSTTVPGETISSDEVEILIPSEAVAVVGVEFNIYHKSIIRAKRDISNYDIRIYLSDSGIVCSRYAECFRLTPAADDVGDYTCTVEVRNLKDYAVIASKSMTLHIIDNTAVSGKKVLFIGDSLTFSRAGLYPAEIQYHLSNGGMISIGTQDGSVDINQIGAVKHEGYNGATIGGFLREKVTSAFANPFYNPATSTFDLGYFLSNNGYAKVDAVCLNLGHNNFGNEVAGVADLRTIITKIHEYDASIPVIISLVPPLGDQDSSYRLSFSAGQMRFHWRQLIKAYIDAFDGGKISNVYLSTPYFNVDQDHDMPTETVARCARDNTQIVRQNDSHPTRVGTLKMADSYYANLLYHLG